jgi:hypothetical protein
VTRRRVVIGAFAAAAGVIALFLILGASAADVRKVPLVLFLAALAPLLFAGARERRIGAEVYRGRWENVGTPEQLAALNATPLSGGSLRTTVAT